MTNPCRDDVCITCSDQLLEVLVDSISDDGDMALGRHQGEPCEVSIALVDGVRAGDTVLVHGGVALQLAGAPLAEGSA